MKRFGCWLDCLMMLFSASFALAEETDDEEDVKVTKEDEALDAIDESIYEITGKVYPEPKLSDFNASSPAIYTARLDPDRSIYAVPELDLDRRVARGSDYSQKVDVLYVGLQWVIIRRGKDIGYVKRAWLPKETIVPVDPVNTPPFNAQKHAYTAVTATTCHVRKTMDPYSGDGNDGNNWVILNPGTKITIWQFYDGWAMVNYMRSYGYIDPNELTDLKPVSPTDEPLYDDCPIAAYTSYYKMDQTERNISRIHNIKVGCEYISIVVKPGEEFNANKVMGPYNRGKGYEQAPVLVQGSSTPGYGGGTCQVASTLYNVVVQLPKLRVTYRRPHGNDGASYLPIHCDAAVGNAKLNFRFVNEYDFPIRIEACSSDDGALSIRIYKAEE